MNARLLLPPAIALALASCGTGTKPATFFESDSLGVRVERFAWVDAKPAAGSHAYEASGRVSVAGLGSHEVSVREESDRAELGATQRLVVTDIATGESRTFTFDPAASGLTIADGTRSVSVVTNADGTYTVDDVPAADKLEALALLDESPVYAEATEHVVAMAYAVSQKPRPRSSVRLPADCGQAFGTHGGVFDCAVCNKLNPVSCAPCPEALDHRRGHHEIDVDRDGTITVKNPKPGAKFKHLIVKARSGEAGLGAATIHFSYPANTVGVVVVDGVTCKSTDEVLKVLVDHKAEVTIEELDHFLADHANKLFEFKIPKQNEGFRDLALHWKKRLAR